MSTPLYRLLYCSRNVIERAASPGQAFNAEQEVQRILDVSRKRNKADKVTGALLMTACGFAQVLEGYRETVERTFERIGADHRHADVSVLTFTPTDKRSFPDWPMGFRAALGPDSEDPLAHVLSDATFSGERATTGGDLLRLLERFVRHEEEWQPA